MGNGVFMISDRISQSLLSHKVGAAVWTLLFRFHKKLSENDTRSFNFKYFREEDTSCVQATQKLNVFCGRLLRKRKHQKYEMTPIILQIGMSERSFEVTRLDSLLVTFAPDIYSMGKSYNLTKSNSERHATARTVEGIVFVKF